MLPPLLTCPETDAGAYAPCRVLTQAKAEYSEFYNTSLLYLACVDIDSDLGPAQRVERAHDLAISALLGETIFNFGELVRTCLLALLFQTRY